ncbi:MAG: hypothetical protein HC904_02520 [Blastochloris sp.]|nr:hypothetical protein [Blastochloris sp.]
MADSKGRQDIVVVMRELTPYWMEALDHLAITWKPNGNLTVLSGGLLGDDLHPWKQEDRPLREADLKVIPPLPRRHWWGTIWPPRQLWEELKRADRLW